MKRILPALTALALSLALFAPEAPADTKATPRNIVVALKGTAVGEMQRLETPSGPVDALCFEVDMIDVNTGEVVGRGVDCLTNVTPNGAGLSLIDYPIFEFPYGTIIAESPVSVRPVEVPFPDVTHLTGSFPAFAGENNIVFANGRFEGRTGSVRMSGGVDMSQLETLGQITFNCIFVIDFTN